MNTTETTTKTQKKPTKTPKKARKKVGRPRKKVTKKKVKANQKSGKKASTKKASTTTRLVTRRELALKLATHPATITKWENQGMPVAKLGRRGKPSYFDLDDVKSWRGEKERARAEGGELNLQQERARKERAQALVSEQTHAVRAGELMRADDVAETWYREISAVRSKLLSWRAVLEEQLARAYEVGGARALGEALSKEVNQLLTELSDGEHMAGASE